MSFTDDDLKRYLELAEKGHAIPAHIAVAIFTRLEAAERVVSRANALSDRCKQEQCGVFAEVDDVDDAEKEWRKVAGK
jgi:hypothetical protein